MKIGIEFDSKTKNSENVIQAVKIFLKKKDNVNFVISAPKKQLATIDNEEKVEIISFNDKDVTLLEKSDCLISFININSFIERLHIEEKINFFTITKFNTTKPGKSIYLVNANKISANKKPDIFSMISKTKDFLALEDKSINKFSYKILINNKDNNDFCEIGKKLIEEDKDYKGLILPEEVFSDDSTFIISQAEYIELFLSTFKSTLVLQEKIYLDYIKGSTLLQFGNYLTRNATSQINRIMDTKTRNLGTYLVGLNKKVLFCEQDSTIDSLLKIFDHLTK
jgi:hypothetical protein